MQTHPNSALAPSNRRTLIAAALLSLALSGCSGPSLAAGSTVSVDVIDRDTGQAIEVYRHRGQNYVAGRPGARYALRITNRSAGRVLAVTAVDGVNIVSGQTAAWGQTGYVFAPGQSYDLTGWRKSDQQVAAFEFTDLPQSYAARTGRPLDVGVIGVAVFRERPMPVVQVPPAMPLERRAERETAAGGSLRSDSAPAATANAGRTMEKSATDSQDLARNRLGTGHGGREASQAVRTAFERASTQPDEVISIQYDRHENLVAAGIIPGERIVGPRPFPRESNTAAYVPDPRP